VTPQTLRPQRFKEQEARVRARPRRWKLVRASSDPALAARQGVRAS
jgi:hypothetical protein